MILQEADKWINYTFVARKKAVYSAKISDIKKDATISGVRTFVASAVSNVGNFFRKLFAGSKA